MQTNPIKSPFRSVQNVLRSKVITISVIHADPIQQRRTNPLA